MARIARLEERLSDHLRGMLLARRINAYYGTHYDADDMDAMSDVDVLEMLAWINANR